MAVVRLWRRWRSPAAKADRAERAVSRLLWERRFERVMLGALVALYLWGFHTGAERDDKTDRAATQAHDAAAQAKHAAAQAKFAVAQITRLATDSNHALCALRGDLENRVKQTDKFLAKHPEGFAGIPAATLRTNANGQRRTIRALSNLKCG